MRKKLFMLFAIILSTSMMPIRGINRYYSGKCGENINWSLDTQTKNLTLSGYGEMYDYSSSRAPWNEYRDYIYSTIIDKRITSISGSAYYQTHISSIEFPDSLKTIGSWAFRDCPLQSVSIPEGVISIEYGAFDGNNSLKKVTFPSTLRYVNHYAFGGCGNIEKVIITDMESWCKIEFGGTGSTPLWYGNAHLYLGNSNEIVDVVVPEGITKISDYAFYAAKTIKSVTFPESLTEIGTDAFLASGIESVILPASVNKIGESAFYNCSKLGHIVCFASQPPIITSNNVFGYSERTINVPWRSVNSYKSNSYWGTHKIQPSFITTFSPTSCEAIFESQKEVISCKIAGGDDVEGNRLDYIGLEPNNTYVDVPFTYRTADNVYNINLTFYTSSLELTTKPSKPVSSTTAILLAETNMSDAEVSCGFEYKRNDAPADMEGNKVYCPVASGQMAGRLKGLKDDVYYKYRAFYQSAAGNMYYGDWQYIFTGDVAVEFDPILYTYEATIVRENEATISGYALAGSEDFTEQGFEYWAESRANGGANAPLRIAAAIGEHKFVQASGIKMSVTLTNLDEGTIYKYRAYGKTGNQFFYGSEQTFTTQGEWHGGQGIDEVLSNQVPSTKAHKILRNGQIFILRGEKVYNAQGALVK